MATNEFLTAKGIKLPLEDQSTTTRETRFEMGLAAQKAIAGREAVDKMYAQSPKDQLHIQKYLAYIWQQLCYYIYHCLFIVAHIQVALHVAFYLRLVRLQMKLIQGKVEMSNILPGMPAF